MTFKKFAFVFSILFLTVILESKLLFLSFYNFYFYFGFLAVFIFLGFYFETLLSFLILLIFYPWFNSLVILFSLAVVLAIVTKFLFRLNFISVAILSFLTPAIYLTFNFIFNNFFSRFGLSNKIIFDWYFAKDLIISLILSGLFIIVSFYICKKAAAILNLRKYY